MTVPPAKEGTLGFLTYLLVAAGAAITFLLGAVLVGSAVVQERLAFPSLGEAVDDGTAFTMALVAFFVALPLLVAGVAILFGRRGGLTGESLRGTSALNALVGVPVAYIVLAVGMLVASFLTGETGQRSAMTGVLDLLVEGFLFMLIGLAPLVALAALVTQVSGRAFSDVDAHPGVHAHAAPHAHYGSGEHVAEPVHEGHAEARHTDHLHINCPRCGTGFTAEGERPLRVACPNCGKTGTIQ